MTTKEKKARKAAAKRHRNETPPVIALGTESDDLIEATKMKADIMNEDNPGGTSVPVIDDAPLVGEPITSTPERSPTNEELATAMQQAANSGEFDPDPFEVWFVERCDAVKDWFTALPSKIKAGHDAIINKWIAFGDFIDRSVESLYRWAYKTNSKFRNKWSTWFPAKVTRDELAEFGNRIAEYFHTGQEELKQMIASKNVVDRGRLDSLLFAVQANQKVRATKLYASLTGADLGIAKEAIEALA